MKTPPLIPFWLLALTAAAIGMAVWATVNASMFDYDWQQTRPASAKPWFYVKVQDTDRTCRAILGTNASAMERINGCATWQPTHCIIYITPDAPRWIIEHEEKHCLGFTH